MLDMKIMVSVFKYPQIEMFGSGLIGEVTKSNTIHVYLNLLII